MRTCHGVCGVCGCLSWSRVAVSVGKRHVSCSKVTLTDFGTFKLQQLPRLDYLVKAFVTKSFYLQVRLQHCDKNTSHF